MTTQRKQLTWQITINDQPTTIPYHYDDLSQAYEAAKKLQRSYPHLTLQSIMTTVHDYGEILDIESYPIASNETERRAQR